MPRLDVDTSTTPPSYVKDAVGNVTGGIRTPAVDAPIAVLSGLPPVGAPGFCVLFGQTKPLTPSQLSAL
jgi:Alpha/beta hydrolase domain